MDSIIEKFSEQRLRDISLVGIQFAEHLVCQSVNDVLIAIVDIGFGQYEVDDLTLFIA